MQQKRLAALMSVTFAAAACTRQGAEPARVAAAPEPVTISCGPGLQAIVKQVSSGSGRTVSRVECVTAPVPVPATRSREVTLLDDQIRVAPPAAPKPKPKAKRPLPPVQPRRGTDEQVAQAPEPPRELPRAEARYRDDDEDAYGRDADAAAERETASFGSGPASAPAMGQKRSGEKSALIIAGSTAAGAGVGAIVGGKKGALLGAVLGGIGGAVFDHKTRDHDDRRDDRDRDHDNDNDD